MPTLPTFQPDTQQWIPIRPTGRLAMLGPRPSAGSMGLSAGSAAGRPASRLTARPAGAAPTPGLDVGHQTADVIGPTQGPDSGERPERLTNAQAEQAETEAEGQADSAEGQPLHALQFEAPASTLPTQVLAVSHSYQPLQAFIGEVSGDFSATRWALRGPPRELEIGRSRQCPGPRPTEASVSFGLDE